MKTKHTARAAIATLATLTASALGAGGADLVPADSGMGRSLSTAQLLLLDPLELDSGVSTATWHMTFPQVFHAKDVEPRLGQALTFTATALRAGGKGDFAVGGEVAGEARWLGTWIKPRQNVAEAGFQFQDAEGEVHIANWPVQGTDWQWLELDLSSDKIHPAYKQEGKNGKVDLPLKRVHFVWFSQKEGPSELAIDALLAASELPADGGQSAPSLRMLGVGSSDAGETLSPQLLVTNMTGQPLKQEIQFKIQQDSNFYDLKPPHPVHGSDHAVGMPSRTELEGKTLEEGSLTDAKDTAASTEYSKEGRFIETFQFIDLGQPRNISHLAYTAGDANWAWKLDVSSSLDGSSWAPVPSLQGVDVHRKWGRQELAVSKPFEARHLRLRWHKDGEKVGALRMPVALHVYDGAGDEPMAIPEIGPVVLEHSASIDVPARSFAMVDLGKTESLPAGLYFTAARVDTGDRRTLMFKHHLSVPTALETVSPDSRYGTNTSQETFAPINRRLGVGWARFENMKWQMHSPEPGVYRFDGSVAPWHVHTDNMIEAYAKQGITILPYLFETPKWASSAPPDAEKRRSHYPPADLSKYGEFVFQVVARYGNRQVPAEELKTNDKKTGLGQLKVYELWNEPNLNDPGWGHWIGTLEDYFEMFRHGAEAAKRADPSAQVANGGFAGINLDLVDRLRTYEYADGKSPLDFVDVLSVHFYTGQAPPEIAVRDTNVFRGAAGPDERTIQQDLRSLGEWRDRVKPGMPIWMTETGYDSAGPRGVGERLQAAYIVRDVMMCFSHGVDKVLLFRDQGSSPSLYGASGVLRDDGTLAPSFLTYATLIRQLDDVTFRHRLPHADDYVYLMTWQRGDRRMLSAWRVEGEATLDLQLKDSTVVDAFGHAAKHNGPLKLGVFPVYLDVTGNAAVDALEKQAEAIKAERVAEQKRQQGLRAYLYDFGTTEHVGTIEIGDRRRYTPVVAADEWDKSKGYGFAPRAAYQNDDARWIKDPVKRDSCRIGKDVTFGIAAQPGRYNLRVGVAPGKSDAELTIEGAAGGTKTVPIPANAESVELEIEATSKPLTLASSDYLNLRYVVLVQP